jgi:hypothetical protein
MDHNVPSALVIKSTLYPIACGTAVGRIQYGAEENLAVTIRSVSWRARSPRPIAHSIGRTLIRIKSCVSYRRPRSPHSLMVPTDNASHAEERWRDMQKETSTIGRRG